jgi:hypothetical protein
MSLKAYYRRRVNRLLIQRLQDKVADPEKIKVADPEKIKVADPEKIDVLEAMHIIVAA